MASATGIPEVHPASTDGDTENEPLLGRPGDVSQREDQNILANFTSGTAALAQGGIWILAALVWSTVLSNKLILFSAHPLLNSAATLLATQAILVLQPTHTPQQKRTGTLTHVGLLALSTSAFIAAFTIIEINKADHPEYRFTSVHGILGLVTYIAIFLQAAIGIAQYFLPTLVFGSVENGKKVYRWHRFSGYWVLILELATIAAATQTSYNKAVLHIRLWTVLVTIVLVIAGVFPRIKKYKLPSL
ncbi:hypothetical protein FQN57_006210 [Myotisia sp. PD_48]|nr:hypothetical protein FQN57_006210 [Myotisia sp. PD_48]